MSRRARASRPRARRSPHGPSCVAHRLFVSSLLLAGGGFLGGGAAGASEAPPYQGLAERVVGRDQGVLVVAEDGEILASLRADRPVHPASLTKVWTTLALLRDLGPGHRFATRFRGAPPRRGAIESDLVVEASGDPFFLPESAALVLAELWHAGVRRVRGRLRVEGSLYYDWKPDPAGGRLRAALGGAIPEAAWRAVDESRAAAGAGRAPRGGLAFGTGADAPNRGDRLLLVHFSPRLTRILKELNAYSNNILHPLSDLVGGAAAVERLARETVPPAVAREIVITNAAGLGRTNRMSPRAAVAAYRALSAELRRRGMSWTDVLPVAGVDRGTLEDRLTEPAVRGAVVAKTGTLPSLGVSALGGVARTERFGEVTFAILNRGVPVAEARRRQDAFVTALLDDAGAIAFSYVPRSSPIPGEEEVVSYLKEASPP